MSVYGTLQTTLDEDQGYGRIHDTFKDVHILYKDTTEVNISKNIFIFYKLNMRKSTLLSYVRKIALTIFALHVISMYVKSIYQKQNLHIKTIVNII